MCSKMDALCVSLPFDALLFAGLSRNWILGLYHEVSIGYSMRHMQNILSKFLNAGLLPIGGEDEKYKLLELASDELAKRLEATPISIYRFALVAFDDRASHTDPVYEFVQEVVLSKWQTIINKIGPSPLQIYRAVIMGALQIAAARNANIQEALVIIARNEPAIHSDPREKQCIQDFLSHLEKKSAKEIATTWINPVDIGLPKLSNRVKKAQPAKEELTSGFLRAAGPVERDGGANPHLPNAGHPWVNEFSIRAAESVHSAMMSFSKAATDGLQDGLRELIKSIESLAIRDAKAELLWVKASLYSFSGGGSYRNLTPSELVFYSALDISRVVAGNAPLSVEYFLRDLVAPIQSGPLSLGDLLSAIGAQNGFPEAQLILEEPMPSLGRRSWLDVALRPNATEDFEVQTGVEASYNEPVPDLSVRIYRELQIRKLLASKQ